MSDDKRYRVLRWKDARSAVNSEVYARDYDVEDNCYLIDGQSNEIIYADGSQMDCPEDMILTRNLEFFVDRMNKLTAASEQAEEDRDRYREGLKLAEKLSIENDECVLCDSDFGADFGINGQLSHQRHCPFAALAPPEEAQDAS